MSGIAGIARPGQSEKVRSMLEAMSHRGQNIRILETGVATLGGVWSEDQAANLDKLTQSHIALDGTGDGHFALAEGDRLLLKRDPVGVAPLYYGWTGEGALCFASEVKGLMTITRNVFELPPGSGFDGNRLETYFQLVKQDPVEDDPVNIARELRRRLETVIKIAAESGNVGSWLSGGLDSSVLAAIAHTYLGPLHTFTAGFAGSTDVVHAQIVAEAIRSVHHVRLVKLEDLVKALPDVIYHLESFDAWLVRSSIMNYLVAELAADYVPAVFSGEGGDELFAGYTYLKKLDPVRLPDELIDITSRLHNTALQRVDRCASAFGTTAHVSFLEPEVFDYALRIPLRYKLDHGVEKWILRQAVVDILPAAIVNRPKAKFWQGSGVEEILAQYTEEKITDGDFARERTLSNGWILNSKEELLYYRIFRQYFGKIEDLRWMGRSKGSPVQ